MQERGRLMTLPRSTEPAGMYAWSHAAATAVIIALVVVLSGCGGTPEVSPSGGTPAAGPLKDIGSFACQLQEQDAAGNITRLAASRYDMLVIDQTRSLKGDEDFDSAGDVTRLHRSAAAGGGKKKVLCYLDAGQAEDYRAYWRAGWRVGSPDWIVAPDPDGWDGNYEVEFWRPEWMDIMRARIDQIISDGYDGAYLDWLAGYSYGPVARAARAQGLDPAVALIDFVREIAAYAGKKPGFVLVAQNAAEMVKYPGYARVFDGIAQESVWYEWAGDPDSAGTRSGVRVGPEDSSATITRLAAWQELGKPVFDIEYASQGSEVERAYSLGRAHGFRTYVTSPALDSLSSTPPPGLPSD
jgi:cysteinyl-tRNA synthetase, unknown class